MELNHQNLSFQLLMLITTPKLAEKAGKIFKAGSLPLQYRFSAEGTASSEIMDVLGLGSIDKCVLISMIPSQLSNVLLKKLHTELKLGTVNSGIAFTIPLNGANSLILRMLAQNAEGDADTSIGKEANNMTETAHVLIAAIVNRGYSGDVMDAAKLAGATGGTIISSRRIGSEDISGFWGLSIQDEKEIVMILSSSDNKLPIMQKIGERCGMRSKAEGVVMSMPVDSVVGI